jgi:nucleoside 2-deoxyribosyltransferase
VKNSNEHDDGRIRAFWVTINPTSSEHSRWSWKRMRPGHVTAWPLAQPASRRNAVGSRPGDPVIGYSAGTSHRQIEALLEIASDGSGDFALRMVSLLDNPVPRAVLKADGRLDELPHFHTPRTSFLSIEPDQWAIVARIVGEANPSLKQLMYRRRWLPPRTCSVRRVFVAGVIQGSLVEREIGDQKYRKRITKKLRAVLPGAEVVDPFELHPKSVDYDDLSARATFEGMISEVGSCDLVVAYLPEASMGTAVEIWEARSLGVPVWVISPMNHNWVIRLYADRYFEDFDSFAAACRELEG